MSHAYIISYHKLWNKLIDLQMTKRELTAKAQITSSTLARMGKGESASLDTLAKICSALNCDLHDIVEFIPLEENS